MEFNKEDCICIMFENSKDRDEFFKFCNKYTVIVIIENNKYYIWKTYLDKMEKNPQMKNDFFELMGWIRPV